MSPRRNWDSPNPSLASECAPPPQNRRGRGGAHSPAGEGLGETNSKIRRRKKKLSTLPTLCQALTSLSASSFPVLPFYITPFPFLFPSHTLHNIVPLHNLSLQLAFSHTIPRDDSLNKLLI